MLARKKARQNASRWTNYFREQESQSYDERFHETQNQSNNLTLTNFRVSQLKNVIIRPTKDPILIAASIEDHLDQLLTASRDSSLKTDPTVVRFRKALTFVRDEAHRTDELNYFDFMAQARELTKNFESRIRAAKFDTLMVTGTRAWIMSFANWV